jgi:hypothetical protein
LTEAAGPHTLVSVSEASRVFDASPVPTWLEELRARAERCVTDGDDECLVGLLPELERDVEWWTQLWAPSAAVAAKRLDRPDALALLESAVAGGFAQPEMLDGAIETEFGSLPQWPALLRRMDANVPPPPVRVVQWPVAASTIPLGLECIDPDGEAELRSVAPTPCGSAWDTCLRLLDWATTAFDLGNTLVELPDALEILQRAEGGRRFACVEYSILLSQALNAVRIPARRVDLRQRNYHVGVNRGHVVSEAWVDDLNKWVVLDGQNGGYWQGRDGSPLGLLELQNALTEKQPVAMVGTARAIDETRSPVWLSYFSMAVSGGYAWSHSPFSPVAQGPGLVPAHRLLRDGQEAYPDLSEIAVGLDGDPQAPTLNLSAPHPYITRFAVHDRDGESILPVHNGGATYPFNTAPGRHDTQLAVVTDYGPCRAHPFIYDVV